MDFLDFNGGDLYFDSQTNPEIETMIAQAANLYPHEMAEFNLLRCYYFEPSNLNVHVSLYRYYYYKHELDAAWKIIQRTIKVSGQRLGYSKNWYHLDKQDLYNGILVSMGLTRYYLLALKASAYLLMRMGKLNQAVLRLEKVIELDSRDQFGAQALLTIAKEKLNETMPSQQSQLQTQSIK